MPLGDDLLGATCIIILHSQLLRLIWQCACGGLRGTRVAGLMTVDRESGVEFVGRRALAPGGPNCPAFRFCQALGQFSLLFTESLRQEADTLWDSDCVGLWLQF